MSAPPLPLSGIRVLELAQIVAGPFCGTLMAEFGAEVIKTELPGKGDDLRRLGPTEDGVNYWYAADNRGKKVITLDLRTPKGQEIVRRLVPLCDVVTENFRPGVLESWGLGWEDLRRLRPSLVMARITAFGQTGPLRQGPGFAAIASAFGGTWYLNGSADLPPARPTPVYPDYLTGLFTAFGVMAALRHRDATGEGQWIDAALYESAFRILEYTPTFYGQEGRGARARRHPALRVAGRRVSHRRRPLDRVHRAGPAPLRAALRHARAPRAAKGPPLRHPRGALGQHGRAAGARRGVVRRRAPWPTPCRRSAPSTCRTRRS